MAVNESTNSPAPWTGPSIRTVYAKLGIGIERVAPSSISGKEAVINIRAEDRGRGEISASVRLSRLIPEGSTGEQWHLAHELAHFMDHCPTRPDGRRHWVRGILGYAHYSGEIAGLLRQKEVEDFLTALTPVTTEVRPRLNGRLVSAAEARASADFTTYQRSKLAVREIGAATSARAYKRRASELFAEAVACFWVRRNELATRLPQVAAAVEKVFAAEGMPKN